MSDEGFMLPVPEGYFGSYDQNEVQLVSETDDPVAYRGGVRASALLGMNLRKDSGNIVREDHRHEEYTVIMHRLAPNRADGAIEIMLREEGTDHVVGKIYIDPKGAHFAMPVYAPNLATSTPMRIALRASNGLFVCAENGGGGAVVADRTNLGPWETFDVVEVP